MHYDDAFAIQLIPAEHVWEMNFVAGMVPFLHKLCSDVSWYEYVVSDNLMLRTSNR